MADTGMTGTGSGTHRQESQTAPQQAWQIWIDRGGTFTDLVARAPDGSLRVHKLLSDNPEQYPDAALAGIRALLGFSAADSLRQAPLQVVKMGTTVATNALLERKGEPLVLVTTGGFADALRIGYQQRPDLFARHIELPEMLYCQVIEADERVTAAGEVITPLDTVALRRQLSEARQQGIECCAIVLMHGYRYPAHEQQAAAIARELGFTQISVSHQVSPLIRLVGRGDTTVVDAYLSPVLRRYVNQVAGELGDVRLQFMQSNGGLTDAHHFAGKDAILSGPAGGVVGMVKTAQQAGFDQVIGFDMGGTSTDVSLFHGQYERSYESEVAGVRVRAPMMDIHTVAAGGGSVLGFDGQRLTVGPDSAGASPGPACYRRGGPLAVTDINLLLGRLQPDYFPAVFGPKADRQLDLTAVQERFARRTAEVNASQQRQRQQQQPHTPESIAEGYLRIAVDHMAGAIKRISVQRGFDVSAYTLACFGGAGAQHACQVADVLAIPRIFIHRLSGVLSAYGMGLADVTAIREQTLEQPLAELGIAEQGLAALESVFVPLCQAAAQELSEQGYPEAALQEIRRLALRYQGSDTLLWLPLAEPDSLVREFTRLHRQQFGFVQPDCPLVVATLQAELTAPGADENSAENSADSGAAQPKSGTEPVLPEPDSVRPVCWQGQWQPTPFWLRGQLQPGNRLTGPAVIIEPATTVVVEPGWQLEVSSADHLILTRTQPLAGREQAGTGRDPVLLEVFNNLFMHLAEQMGDTLRQTASSVNIKERLDFSCALFDPDGYLVANAPHMPVHLGSMGETVRSALAQNQGDIQPGDVWLINSPYHGGTHLPDLTVITPVFSSPADGSEPDSESDSEPGTEPELLFIVASRGHHADIGGISPGSMPPDSSHISHEGVLFENFLLVRGGQLREQALLSRLASARFPARNPQQNLADLKAQIAANQQGVDGVRRMVAHFSLPVVQAYMGHVQDHAEQCVRRAVSQLSDGDFTLPLDDGSQIQVAVRVDKIQGSAEVDFSGTSAQQAGNFNAPSAVVRAVVLYVFRTLVDEAIPMNAGCLRPVKLIIPQGSMLAPEYPAAVVAGNVEVSQCVTDALYGALGVMASAQGTMNNLTFGDDSCQYYETICGGSGGGLHGDGTSAVQTHMTNSRLTDPEVLELRYPVLLERFAVREHSGGQGRFRGGDGVERTIRFLRPMQASVLSNRRLIPPFGLAGGKPGAAGENRLLRADGSEQRLGSCAGVQMQKGDRLQIRTPGGGGFGEPDQTGAGDGFKNASRCAEIRRRHTAAHHPG